MLYLYFDGLCLPKNPGGVACYGFVIYEDGRKLAQGYGLAAEPWSSEATSNVAEYYGLMKGLEWLVENRPGESLRVRGDSKLVIMQMKGEFKVRSRRLLPFYKRCKELEARLGKVAYEWIPRGENEEADRLSERAYREFMERARLRSRSRSSP